jgi:16S rRNA (guanine527-N7)-methyltransferase
VVGRLLDADRRIHFEYDPSFLKSKLELSPFKLPLKPGVFSDGSAELRGLYGLFNDSLPDGWGLRLMHTRMRERGIDRFIDLGSGGGYPGIPIAAALPAARALLLEPVAKKAGFLSAVVSATGLGDTVEAAAVRAEALAADRRHRGRWPGVTVRAVAGLAELVELAFPLLEPGGALIAWKRGDIDTELVAAERAIDALGGGSLEVRPVTIDGLHDHRLVVISSRGRVPAGYPRDPGARKRRPW